MRRITVSVTDEMHRALRLLAIFQDKAFGTLVLEALDFYLRHHGGYDLDVSRKELDRPDA
jgi:hypothetical protein